MSLEAVLGQGTDGSDSLDNQQLVEAEHDGFPIHSVIPPEIRCCFGMFRGSKYRTSGGGHKMPRVFKQRHLVQGGKSSCSVFYVFVFSFRSVV